MDDPFKVIWKYKNENKKYQYLFCIAVGNILPKTVKKVLKKIKDLNLFDTLISLTEAEYKAMAEKYKAGQYWYRNFFPNKHIEATIKNIRNNKSKKDDIIEKYGEDWYKLHIAEFEYFDRSYHNYGHLFKQIKERKNKNQKIKESDHDDEINDYSAQSNRDTAKSLYLDDSGTAQVGGNLEEEYDIGLYEFTAKDEKRLDIYDSIESEIQLNAKMNNINSIDSVNLIGGKYDDDDDERDTNDDLEPDVEMEESDNESDDEDISVDADMVAEAEDESEEYDITYDENAITNLELLQIDEDAAQLSKDIHNIIDEDADMKYNQMAEFDDSKNNLMNEGNLKEVFSKVYIFNQYIYRDDTIHTIKNKIACGIKQDPLIGHAKAAPYLLPSRLYLWSEYEYEEGDQINKVIRTDKVMLGQKWIKRNELLGVDVEPADNIRVYEQLKYNLKNLRDSIMKYGSKIKREMDEGNILDEYSQYITNNEIFMLDIYHELGNNYEAHDEVLRNVYSVYVKIYYNLTQDEFKQIIDFMDIKHKSTDAKMEINRISQYYQNLNNDLLLENEVCKIIEELKTTPEIYSNIFKNNFVTQSVIHVSLQHYNISRSPKVDLFRIFDNFVIDDTYPFLQYQVLDGKLIFKFDKHGNENDKNAILSKWFENAPYGISFKIRVPQKGDSSNKYISVNLNESGQIEYKTQWKEDDHATIEDVKNTFPYIRNLLKKINSENDKLQFTMPADDKFKYAFINTILQVELPGKYMINHNDLSDFARLFFPYIAVVVEPRKRQSKIKTKDDKTSKFGSYFRYKRISKYENEARIEHRIVYFLRNYEYIEKLLVGEISKQFNITEKQALDKIEEVKQRFTSLKKSRKVLKKFDNIPKYKPPGIDVNIQGKQRDKYKMRVSGARNKYQLDKIVNFMNILIYIYVEVYLRKNPEMGKLKEKLKQVAHIAKRRNRVEEIVYEEHDVTSVKQITKMDKDRLAYKPEKGQNQWSRNCQQSGKDKKRRPIPYTDKNIDELLKQGYVYNSATGDYERTVTINKNGKKKEVVLRAAKLTNNDGTHIYYTCSPEENKDHMYVGFLSRSLNPNGLCLPCCFIKDHYTSKNKEKRDFYMKCVGKFQETGKVSKKIMGEKLYILQDTNKIQEGRFGYLPKYLDLYFNILLNKTKVIKNHYLISSKSGYFFKFGSKQDEFPYLNAIANATELTIDDIKSKIKQILTSDNKENNMRTFTYLNNGDIRTQFTTIDSYLHFLAVNMEIDHTTIDDMLCIPGVLFDGGANVFIFEKRMLIVDEMQGENMLKEDYVLICKNIENVDMIYDTGRKNIILLKEEVNYYPIYMTLKEENTKTIDLLKVFDYQETNNNIIKHLSNYFKINCNQSSMSFLKTDTAKTTYTKLQKIKKEYNVKGQVIDKRNKCKYLILHNGHLFPVKPSGTILEINLTNSHATHVNTLQDTVENLMNIYKLSPDLYCRVQGYIYDQLADNNYHIIAVITDQSINVPVQPITINYHDLAKLSNANGIKHFITDSRSLYDEIDEVIAQGPTDEVDDRIINVKKAVYDTESYELFRLELSEYLHQHPPIKNKIINVIESSKYDHTIKKNILIKMLFKILSKEILELYNGIQLNVEDILEGGKVDTNKKSMSTDNIEEMSEAEKVIFAADKTQTNFVELVPSIPEENILNYQLNNNREVCKINTSKTACKSKPHCTFVGSCKFMLTRESLIYNVNRVVDELVSNKLKSSEILRIDNYMVSDIVNPDNYKERSGQKIIKSINYNIQKILGEIFGKNNIPMIGKHRVNRFNKPVNHDILLHPIEKIGNFYIQLVNNLNSVFRAYANGFYWLKNTYSDVSYRNIGYYSPLQTDLVNLFKSFIIDYLLNKKRTRKMMADLESIIKFENEEAVDNYLESFIKISIPKYIAIVDLYVLNQLHHIPIILYDIYDQAFCIIDNGIKYLKLFTHNVNLANVNDYLSKANEYINIKYAIVNPSLSSTIANVYALYFE
jgi:hypothetical protein